MAEIHGMCDERFSAVRVALEESLDNQDVGASAAVYLDGEPVVDIWGGYANAERTVAWREDTITSVWSTSKTMVALCALILADRGELDLDAPVASYWPEFAAAGKEDVRVRHLLSHTAGLPDFDDRLTAWDLLDRPAILERLERQAPRWEPGALGGYHSMTMSFLVGEVIRRVTGRPLETFFAQEVAGPLGADFQFRLTAEDDSRFAPGIAPPGAGADWSSAPPGVGSSAGIRLADVNKPAWRYGEFSPGNGYGNARSVAAVQSVVACGGTARGVRLLSRETCELARQVQYQGIDQVLGGSMRWGMGYAIFDRSIGWGGWGGSMVMVDLDARMSIAYVMNQMLSERGGDPRALGIVIASYQGIQS